MSAKDLHDKWLEQKPEGAKHPDDCPFCVGEPTGGAGDSMSDEKKTYTSEELAAAIALAVQPLKDQIQELEAKDAEAEIDTKIAEATAALEAKVSEVQQELDVKVAELAAATKALEDVQAYLEAEAARVAEEAAVEARKVSRLEEVKENASYSDEYLNTHADRWASLTDDEFAGLIEDLKAAGGKKEKDDVLPPNTRLHASETANRDDSKSVLGTILDLRRAGIDARRIH